MSPSFAGWASAFSAFPIWRKHFSLRNAGADGDILILGVTPAEYADVLAQQNISQSVFCTEYAEKLSQAATAAGVTVKCHLKIDTGMGRIGFVNQLDSDATQEVLSVCKLQNLSFEGIFSHFSVADELSPESLDYTDAQQNAFNSLVQRLQDPASAFTISIFKTAPASFGIPIRSAI